MRDGGMGSIEKKSKLHLLVDHCYRRAAKNIHQHAKTSFKPSLVVFKMSKFTNVQNVNKTTDGGLMSLLKIW